MSSTAVDLNKVCRGHINKQTKAEDSHGGGEVGKFIKKYLGNFIKAYPFHRFSSVVVSNY
jgi:hypothetical protein